MDRASDVDGVPFVHERRDAWIDLEGFVDAEGLVGFAEAVAGMVDDRHESVGGDVVGHLEGCSEKAFAICFAGGDPERGGFEVVPQV